MIEKIRYVELRYIAEIIPSKLYKKFNSHNIHTINDGLRTSINDFGGLEFVGRVKLKLYENFKKNHRIFRKNIFNEPEKLH